MAYGGVPQLQIDPDHVPEHLLYFATQNSQLCPEPYQFMQPQQEFVKFHVFLELGLLRILSYIRSENKAEIH